MGALTLIQSGFFSAATSGRWAFSGWRGLLVASSTTVMAAPRLTYGRRAAGARRPVVASARHIAGRHGTGIMAHLPYQGKARLPPVEFWHISDRSLRSRYFSRLTSLGGGRACPPSPA